MSGSSSLSLQTAEQRAQGPMAIEASLHLISPNTDLRVHLWPPRFFLLSSPAVLRLLAGRVHVTGGRRLPTVPVCAGSQDRVTSLSACMASIGESRGSGKVLESHTPDPPCDVEELLVGWSPHPGCPGETPGVTSSLPAFPPPTPPSPACSWRLGPAPGAALKVKERSRLWPAHLVTRHCMCPPRSVRPWGQSSAPSVG